MNTQPLRFSYSFHSRHLYFLGILGLFFSGCAEPLYWAKPEAQPGEFERAVIECQKGLGLPVSKEFSLLDPTVGKASITVEHCLADKGWFLARKPAQ